MCLVPVKGFLCLYKEFHIGNGQKLPTAVEGDEKILLDDGLRITQAVNARGIRPHQTPGTALLWQLGWAQAAQAK